MISNCLQAHTSGETQLLDVGLYSVFKLSLNVKKFRATQIYDDSSLERFFAAIDSQIIQLVVYSD